MATKPTNLRHLDIDQGSSKDFIFTITTDGEPPAPFDLTGYTARAQVRRSYGAKDGVLINCTLANGKLVLTDVAGGVLTLSLAPEDTSLILFADKEDAVLVCVYDLEIISPTGDVYKPARGNLTLHREVTR